MDNFAQTMILIDSKEFTKNQMVTLLELITDNLEINTLSEMARLENKSRNGIIVSNNYKKIEIGKQTFAIKGVKQDKFPF